MQQNQQAIQQLVQQFEQLHVQPAIPAPAPAPAHAPVQHEYNWVRMPEKFVGRVFNEFLDDYLCCSTANGWDEQNCIQRFGPYLSGHALILFNTLRDNQKQNWADLRTTLLALLYPPESRTARSIEFQAIQYVSGESIDIYAYRFERSFDQVNPDYINHPDIRTKVLKSQFINGLPEPFHTRRLESSLLTYDQCITTAFKLLAASKLGAQPTQYTSPVVGPKVAPIPVNAFWPLYKRPHDYCPDNCYWYQKSSPRGSTPRCFNCSSTSHRVQDCEVTPAKVFRKHERTDRHDSRERRSSLSPYRRSRRDSSSEHHVEFSNNHLVTARSDNEYCLEGKIEGVA